ncbi:iron-binding protein [Synechococcus phage S-CREM1]|nr:iron-binding protein [Synechococcus phage S-CREM1]
MKLTPDDAIYAANKFIDYYSKFQRIDDYLRFVKNSRLSNESASLFGPEDEIFSDFNIHPQDMSFKIHQVDTSPKPKSKYNQSLYSEILNKTASNAIEEAIPGRTLKWIVVEETTKKIIGVVRFGSPTINSKPRNEYFGEVLPLSTINQNFVMGFNIVPTQPFGYNYLGGKLLALLASSNELKRQFDDKYKTDLKYFETTSLYGTTKGVSMYDGLKPYIRHIGDTESNFLPLFHDDEFRDFFWWFNERNNGERLISADKSSKKLKIQTKMISIITNSLTDESKLKEFKDCISHAKTLTEKKRYYISKFGYEVEEVIEWWKKKATKRYEKLVSENKLRTQLELWKPGVDLEIIR